MNYSTATDRLSAIKIGRHWYYKADKTCEWYRIPVAHLRAYALIYARKQDGYSLWCADYATYPLSRRSVLRLGLEWHTVNPLPLSRLLPCKPSI